MAELAKQKSLELLLILGWGFFLGVAAYKLFMMSPVTVRWDWKDGHNSSDDILTLRNGDCISLYAIPPHGYGVEPCEDKAKP